MQKYTRIRLTPFLSFAILMGNLNLGSSREAYADLLVEGAYKKPPALFGRRTLDLGVTGFDGGDSDDRILRKLVYARFSLWLAWRFFAYANGGMEWIRFQSGQPQPAIEYAEVSASAATLVAGGGLGFLVPYLETKHFRLTAFAEGEKTPWNAKLRLDSLEVMALGRKVNAAGIVREHVELEYTWYLLRSGLLASYRFGKIAPYLTLGYFRFDATIRVTPDAALQRTMRALGAAYGTHPVTEREDRNTVLAAAGANFDVTRAWGANFSVILIPIDRRLTYGGQSALSLRF